MHWPSDHILLTINISINEKFIQDKKCIIIRNGKEEEKFITELTNALESIDISNILSRESLKGIIQEYIEISDSI